MNELVLGDGRVLDVRVSGPEDGLPLVFHHGTPGTLPSRSLERAAHALGLRLVSFSRPGYGGSTRRLGRDVADVVTDTATVLQSIGAERHLLVGWSGGGPHALACAARLPGAVGALVVASLAPSHADGLDFLAGMSRDNLDEWTAAFDGSARLRAHVAQVAPDLLAMPAEPVVADAGLPAADAAVLTGESGEDLVAANRDGLRLGVDGWVDDELAFTRPWGFELAEIVIPVVLGHGGRDVNVPLAHGEWLASELARGSMHREEHEGHLSIMGPPVDRLLGLLLRQTS